MYPPSHVMDPLEKRRPGWRREQQVHEPVLYPIYPTHAHMHILSLIDLGIEMEKDTPTHEFHRSFYDNVYVTITLFYDCV